MSPVIANCGNMSAIATPTAAEAMCMFSSAWRTSGRCSTSFEGTLTGTSVGKVNSSRRNVSSGSSAGSLPSNAVRASRVWPSCFCSGGSVCAVCASKDCCARMSKSLAVPSKLLFLYEFGQLMLQLEQRAASLRSVHAARPPAPRSRPRCCSRSGRWPRVGNVCSPPAPWRSPPAGGSRPRRRGG